jgi:hypothetical protein
MIEQIQQLPRKSPGHCQRILCVTTCTYRPLHLLKVGALSDLPPEIASKEDAIAKIVTMCGSFLTVRDKIVSTIHQSAQDFLSTAEFVTSSRLKDVHYTIYL